MKMGNIVQKTSITFREEEFHGGVAYVDTRGHRSILYEATR